jgi:hypothetical protein
VFFGYGSGTLISSSTLILSAFDSSVFVITVFDSDEYEPELDESELDESELELDEPERPRRDSSEEVRLSAILKAFDTRKQNVQTLLPVN